MHLALLTILVRDYDEAIAYYTRTLGFTLVEDTTLEPPSAERPFAKRWVRVRPPVAPGEPAGAEFLLAQASNPAQAARVGDQTGGRVGIFLHTDDFWRDYRALADRGVPFVRPPTAQEYGTVAVFKDLYGNLFDLVGRRPAPKA